MNQIDYIDQLKEKICSVIHNEADGKKLISYAQRLSDSELPVIFSIEHFAMLIGIKIRDLVSMLYVEKHFYRQYRIPKKNGTERILSIPSADLKYIQRWILDNILSRINISEHAMGFSPKKSIVTNAQIHLDSDCVINIDIKDFFPSITFERIFRIFNYYGYSKKVSFCLAKLCSYQGALPQGSPASPCISNIVCLRLDKRLSKFATINNVKYSRYADDLTISGSKSDKNLLPMIKTIIMEENFTINDSKTRTQFKNQRQIVTGLIVNQGKVRVDKSYKRKIEQEIYYCTKFGVSSHLARIKCTKTFYKEHLYGKAYFIYMVEPEVGRSILADLNKIAWDY